MNKFILNHGGLSTSVTIDGSPFEHIRICEEYHDMWNNKGIIIQAGLNKLSLTQGGTFYYHHKGHTAQLDLCKAEITTETKDDIGYAILDFCPCEVEHIFPVEEVPNDPE